MASVCNEQRIWRSLVTFHFTPQQTEAEIAKMEAKGEDKDTDWKKVFHQLRK